MNMENVEKIVRFDLVDPFHKHSVLRNLLSNTDFWRIYHSLDTAISNKSISYRIFRAIIAEYSLSHLSVWPGGSSWAKHCQSRRRH